MILKQITVFNCLIVFCISGFTCSRVRMYETLDGKYRLQSQNAFVKIEIGGILGKRGAEFQISTEGITDHTLELDLSKICATISFFTDCVKPSYRVDFDEAGFPDWQNRKAIGIIAIDSNKQFKTVFVFDQSTLPVPYEKNIWREFMKTHTVEIHPNQPKLITTERWQFRMNGGENDWF